MIQEPSHKTKSRGITLVEVVVGVTIFSLITLVLLYSMTLFLSARNSVNDKTKALYLAEEGMEAARYLRDVDWTEISGLTVDTPYYFSLATTTVAIVSAPAEVIDSEFRRQLIVREVHRDTGTDDIVASTTGGSYNDADSREIVVQVGIDSSTTTLRTILTNLFDI